MAYVEDRVCLPKPFSLAAIEPVFFAVFFGVFFFSSIPARLSAPRFQVFLLVPILNGKGI